jgi:hypothetical protein
MIDGQTASNPVSRLTVRPPRRFYDPGPVLPISFQDCQYSSGRSRHVELLSASVITHILVPLLSV